MVSIGCSSASAARTASSAARLPWMSDKRPRRTARISSQTRLARLAQAGHAGRQLSCPLPRLGRSSGCARTRLSRVALTPCATLPERIAHFGVTQQLVNPEPTDRDPPLPSPYIDPAGPHPPLLRKQKTATAASRGHWATPRPRLASLIGRLPVCTRCIPRQVGAAERRSRPLLRGNGQVLALVGDRGGTDKHLRNVDEMERSGPPLRLQ
jgi:hypothetical protein